MKGPSKVTESDQGPSRIPPSGVHEPSHDVYPVFLRLRNRRVLVVGGGEIALQRVRKLLAAGAKVTLIAPNIKPEFEPLAESEQLRLVHRAFQRADVNGQYFLVIGATNHPPTQTALWEEAEKLGLLCNVVDDPQHCNYFTPAVVERGICRSPSQRQARARRSPTGSNVKSRRTFRKTWARGSRNRENCVVKCWLNSRLGKSGTFY